jgi:glucosamine--fructose-6-phosphate aminotransferase (isomerizing)
MCGIVGAIANRNVVPILTEGLKRLEYRGYDSAGIAVLNGGIKRVRRVGRVSEMESASRAEGLNGIVGIAHTRWATHGGVTEPNAHPHVSMNEIAVVHNGIIENHEAQRERLKALGYVFESQTDTEVIAHLIHYYFKQRGDLFAATRLAAADLHGAYAIGVVALADPETMTGARMGCPLVVGLGDGENFLASDVSAMISETRRVIYLEDGDVIALRRGGVEIVDPKGQPIERKVFLSELSASAVELGPYRHYMQKEIHEQPRAVADTLEGVIDAGIDVDGLFGAGAKETMRDLDGVLILASGTSYYAGLVARYWMESIARVPCTVELGHEYRYRESIANPRQLVVTISQSGETLDTHGGAQAREGAGTRAHAFDLQRARKRHSARFAVRLLHARRGRDRRRLDEGIHDAARLALHAHAFDRQGEGPPRLQFGAGDARANALRARQHPARAESRAPDPGLVRAVCRARPCALPRPRHPLPDRARRRLEAEGNLVHPRRGLSRRRAQARARWRSWIRRCRSS